MASFAIFQPNKSFQAMSNLSVGPGRTDWSHWGKFLYIMPQNLTWKNKHSSMKIKCKMPFKRSEYFNWILYYRISLLGLISIPINHHRQPSRQCVKVSNAERQGETVNFIIDVYLSSDDYIDQNISISWNCRLLSLWSGTRRNCMWQRL